MSDHEAVAAIDVMRLRLANERVRRAVAEMTAAEMNHRAAVAEARTLQAEIVDTYGLREGDGIDMDNGGAITRADNGQAGAAELPNDPDEASP